VTAHMRSLAIASGAEMSSRFTLCEHNNPHGQFVALELYHAPKACSRVVLVALEEIGEPYREDGLALARQQASGDQFSPEYIAINPKSKVPSLVDSGRVLTETPVILYHLATTRPDANLLPLGEDGRPLLEAVSDMVWISGILHLTMNQIVMPQNTSPKDPEGARAFAKEQFSALCRVISKKYKDALSYYGGKWSIIDTYFSWVLGLVKEFGFPFKDFPKLDDLVASCEVRPAFMRAISVEAETNKRKNLLILSPKLG